MTTQILKIDPQDPQIEQIIKAAEVIKRGGLVAFPTETVYGLGADFFNEDAVRKLYEVKQRPQEKPCSVHIAEVEDLRRFECDISSFAGELIARFWPGPVTLIFETKKSGKVGFRLPNNNIARELIRQSATLIAAPSANISGSAAPTNSGEVLNQLNGRIDLIIDAGETALSRESTVIDMAVAPYRIVREGAIARQSIAEFEFDFWKNKVAPTIKKILFVCTGNSCRSVLAEWYLKKRHKQVERDDIQVFSRGINASAIAKATTEALAVLSGEGIYAGSHVSTRIAEEDIKEADLILAMEEFQRDEIVDMAPSRKERVYLLAEFGLWGGRSQDAPLEIQDPIGRPLQVYKDVFVVVKNSVERLVKILI